jgi:alpha-L-fucosidase
MEHAFRRARHLDIMRAQRIYNNSRWPNPVVVKLSAVEPA